MVRRAAGLACQRFARTMKDLAGAGRADLRSLAGPGTPFKLLCLPVEEEKRFISPITSGDFVLCKTAHLLLL